LLHEVVPSAHTVALLVNQMFVPTLGHSRRLHVRAFRAEKQEHWFAGLESAFTTFGGVPEEVLMDNPRALVVRHDAVSRSVVFNDKLIAFAKHWGWGFRPRACAPYRARTKGKTESGVGYVKKNAIAGHCFASWEAFEAHLAKWERGWRTCVSMARSARQGRDEKTEVDPVSWTLQHAREGLFIGVIVLTLRDHDMHRQHAAQDAGERLRIVDGHDLEVAPQRIFWVTPVCQLLPVLAWDGTHFFGSSNDRVLHRLASAARGPRYWRMTLGSLQP
jgi:hypothetical protein